MEPVRPHLAPDPSLTRDEMESLQNEVAETAIFEDDLPFDPGAVSLSAQSQSTLGASVSAEDESGSDANDGARSTPGRPLVAGVDQSFLGDDRAVSAIVLMEGDEVVDRVHAVTPLEIEYIPGLLSFREGGSILAAFEKLDRAPDLALFDGSGRIHFRQAGLATHMGTVLDLPSVGVAKSLLCGRARESVDGRPAGWRTAIEANERVNAPEGTVIGYAYQSRQYDSDPIINPLYVSPGHRLSAETAVDVVAALGGGYKLPEPTRLADKYADDVKSEVT